MAWVGELTGAGGGGVRCFLFFVSQLIHQLDTGEVSLGVFILDQDLRQPRLPDVRQAVVLADVAHIRP